MINMIYLVFLNKNLKIRKYKGEHPMSSKHAPIGVLDTGIGGYTVVKELQALLPNEDIIFFGDGANTPYGNRSEADILHLTRQMLQFLSTHDVKAVAIACNTISTLIDQYQDDLSVPIFGIAQAGSDDVIALAPKKAIVLSTVFTAKIGSYPACVAAGNPNIQVISQGSPNLAAIVEKGDFNPQAITTELAETLGVAAAAHPDADTLVLGCTHYPLILDYIQRDYPQFTNIINPALSQTKQLQHYLADHDLLNPQDQGGNFSIYTSGDCQGYIRMAEIAKLTPPDAVTQKFVTTPL